MACRVSSRRWRTPRWSIQTTRSTLIRIVLRGARSVTTNHEPTSPGMPSFGWQLDDSKLAAVVTYVRNAWGFGAAAVSSGDVATARSDLGKRTN